MHEISFASLEQTIIVEHSSEKSNDDVAVTHGDPPPPSFISAEDPLSGHGAEPTLSSSKGESSEVGTFRRRKHATSELADLLPRNVIFSKVKHTKVFAKEQAPQEVSSSQELTSTEGPRAKLDNRKKLQRQATGAKLPQRPGNQGGAPDAHQPIARNQSLPTRAEKREWLKATVQESLRKDSIQDALDDFKSLIGDLDEGTNESKSSTSEDLDTINGPKPFGRTLSGLIEKLEATQANDDLHQVLDDLASFDVNTEKKI